MHFTPRFRQIIMLLHDVNHPVTVKYLAIQMNLSRRTISRELEYLGSSLDAVSVTLCSKTGVGIWLEGSPEALSDLREKLENQNDLDSANQTERRQRLILELLKDRTPKKLYYYSNIFDVSETTVGKDIEKIAPWFETFSLHLQKKPGIGVSLSGSEKAYRTAIRAFIAQNADHPLFHPDSDTKDPAMTHTFPKQNTLLDERILQGVCRCISSISDDGITRLTQQSFTGLVIHTTIAVERVLGGSVIEADSHLMENLTLDEDLRLSHLIISNIEKEFDLEIPDIEIYYICLHLKASKHQMSDLPTDDEVSQLVQESIEIFDSKLAIALLGDKIFLQGLASHLKPTLVRIRNDMLIANPHLEAIRTQYSETFNRCLAVSTHLAKYLGKPVPDTETGFLAIHFGAALVRLENSNHPTKIRCVAIGVLCSNGIGLSQLMASRLKNYFGNRIMLTTYGTSDITSEIKAHNDFFISSLAHDLADAELIVVNPFLSDDDLKKIEQRIAFYANTLQPEELSMDFSSQMAAINLLSNSIFSILKYLVCQTVPSDLSPAAFLEMAVRAPLSTSDAQKELIRLLVKRERQSSQIIPELSIALYHARAPFVTEPSISIFTPSDGADTFTDPDFKGIRAALILLIPDDKNSAVNSRLIGRISQELVESNTFLEAIQSGNKDRIYCHLEQLLKRYFNQMLKTS